MRFVSALLLAASVAAAGGLNTDAAITVGERQFVSRTQARYESVEQSIDRYLARTTIVYGVTPRITGLATIGYAWQSPGPDGLTDLFLRGRFKIFGRDRKRETLVFSATLGGEIPVGETPIGNPDGGLVAGLVGTFERDRWRVDADVQRAWRPDAGDVTRADVAVSYRFVEAEASQWLAILELNYRRVGRGDVLFLAPGLSYGIPGWSLEMSIQIAVATDVPGPAPEFAAVFGVVRVF